MTYWYIATPFTKYPHGHEAAYRLACVETARLLRAGIPCLSPIAHGFGLHAHGGLPVVDAVLWHRVNLPLMMGAAGCIVIMAEGWAESSGVAEEINWFRRFERQVRYIAVGATPSGL